MINTAPELKETLPNFFIVGAMKAGTTSLANALSAHAEVYMSPIKEPNFFAVEITTSEYADRHRRLRFDPSKYVQKARFDKNIHFAFVKDMDTYIALYSGGAAKQARGEASTYYLVSPSAPREISNLIPDARIIMILREPIERAYSEYLMNYYAGDTAESFKIELQREAKLLEEGKIPVGRCYVSAGHYADQIQGYREHFSDEQICILLYDDLKANFRSVLSRVADHLGISDTWADKGVDHANSTMHAPRFPLANKFLNETGLKKTLTKLARPAFRRIAQKSFYRSPPSIASADIQYLRNIFRPEILRLEHLIDRDLSNWMKPPYGDIDVTAAGPA